MFTKKYVAIDIGNKNIKIAYGSANKKCIELYEYDIIETPQGSVKDGKIFDIELLTTHIRNALKKNRIHEKQIIFCVSGSSIIIRDIQLPKANEEEIEKMLEYEAQQYFPVNLSQYNMDFKICEEITSQDSIMERLLVVAAPQKLINDYMQLAKDLRMEVEAIDIPSNCTQKFLYGFGTDDKEIIFQDLPQAFTVVDLGHDSTVISIFNEKVLKFIRILFNGSSEYERLIANSFNKNIIEAENMKKNLDKIRDSEELSYIESILQTSFSNQFNEILRLFDFYYSKPSAKRLEKIYLIGGGSRLNLYKNQMATYLGAEVENLFPVNVKPEDKDIIGINKLYKRVKYMGKKKKNQFADDAIMLVNVLGALVR